MLALRASVPRPSHVGRLPGRAFYVGVVNFRRSIHVPPAQTKHHSAIKDIRNIGIIAHVDAGKTTTTERMLYYSGVTRRVGDVDAGNTVTDFLELERERGITIQSAAITFNWPLPQDCQPGTNPKTINLIDTPGHQDFRFEVDRCLPVLDGAVCIIDSVKGVEAHTERVWASAHEHKIPRIVFVNKLDRDGASFRKSVLEIGSRLNGWPLVCQIPWWEGDQFVGVIDVIDRVGYRWKTEKEKTKYEFLELQEVLSGNSLMEEIEVARERLVEGLADWDEAIMDLFADDPSKITSQLLKEGVRRVIRSGDGTVIPVLAGASFRHIGVEPLMDAIVDYLPSPDERPELEVRIGANKQELVKLLDSHSSKKASHGRVAAVASVFKVFNHPKEGVLSFVRVYHGELHRNSSTWNTHTQLSEKPFGLLQISAEKTEDVQHLATGQIGAIKGLKKARTGDTLLTSAGQKGVPDSLKHVQIRPPEIPPAVAFLAIDPQGNTAAKELEIALENASREDPSLRWSRDEKTEQFILQGMGKLHLDIAVYNLKQNSKVQADFGPIEVDYKECLTAPFGPHHVIFDRVVASKSGKVSCSAMLEPLEEHHRQAALEPSVERDGNIIHIIINLPEDGSLPGFDPEEARQQLLNGVVAAVARGPRRGSPVQGCHITITVDASEAENPSGGHFTGAAHRAVREALREAHTARQAVGVLEPVMLVNISCPEAAAGMVQHDISSGAGGHVLEVNDKSAESSSRIDVSSIYAPPDPYESVASLRGKKSTARTVEIVAKVPFKEVLDFDEHLRGKTGGRHSMTMAFDSFDRVVGTREKAL
ncbi:translation elongation factor G [Colletotrichum truncatum]|uniref:Translation elongation factor G n=1 Tax=Colletotrichum truncatum TaxID=5467 RepID=A0ACC3ZK89_COLTU|nr:translation elongation factor G [Colletotrichum truncatum]KAF6799715.1 translation elongation factor G [Colletotrichum truncatum]